MKKLIGVLGVAVITVAIFFSANNVSGLDDTSLATLMNMNNANAEGSVCWNCALISTDVCGFIGMDIYIGYAYNSHAC